VLQLLQGQLRQVGGPHGRLARLQREPQPLVLVADEAVDAQVHDGEDHPVAGGVEAHGPRPWLDGVWHENHRWHVLHTWVREAL